MKKKSNSKCPASEKILSVGISTMSKQEILKEIFRRAKQKRRTVIFTPNPQMLLQASTSKRKSKLLNSADFNIPDGIGVVIASKLKNGKIKKRISGIDIAEDILYLSQKNRYKVFLLGGKRGVAKKAKQLLRARYPRLDICGTHHGYFNKSGKDNDALIKTINQTSPDIIFVCMGYPMQEEWIIKNADKIKSAKVFIGLGGSLDVWSGKIHRAPAPFKILGLEWLYRTLKEPKRARIFLDIPIFLFKVLKGRTTHKYSANISSSTVKHTM